MQLVKLYDTIRSFSKASFIQRRKKKKETYSLDLLVKQGAQPFIKNSEPFISVVSVQSKVMFKFMMTLISSKSVS